MICLPFILQYKPLPSLAHATPMAMNFVPSPSLIFLHKEWVGRVEVLFCVFSVVISIFLLKSLAEGIFDLVKAINPPAPASGSDHFVGDRLENLGQKALDELTGKMI